MGIRRSLVTNVLLAVTFLGLLSVGANSKAAAGTEVDVYLLDSEDGISWVLDDLEGEHADDGGIGGGSSFSVRREGEGRFGEKIVVEALSGDVLIPTKQAILNKVVFYEYEVSRPIGWDALYEARGCTGAGTSKLTCNAADASGGRLETVAPYLAGPTTIEIDGPGCSGRNGLRLSVLGLTEYGIGTDGYLRNTSGSGYDDGLVSGDNSRVDGCSGDDFIAGGGRLYGGQGNDAFGLLSPKTKIWGGPGRDSIEAENGAPNMEVHGGGGGDDFELDGWAKGSTVFGDAGNDGISIVGSKAWGGPGRDLMYEEGGKQQVGTLYGGPGPDRLESGPGMDRLFGQGGNDRIYNSSGSRLIPGTTGGGGTPLFKVRPTGVDKIDCGAGKDFALAASKARARGCERIKRMPYLVGPFGDPIRLADFQP